MSESSWDEVLAAYLDGETLPAAAELTDAQAAELVDLVELDRLLAHQLRTDDAAEFQKGVDRRIEAETTKSAFLRRVDRRLPSKGKGRLLIAAASIAAATLVIWYLASGPTAPERIAVLKGRAEVRGTAVAGEVDLFPGDSIRTSEGARVRYESGTTLEIAAATSLRLSDKAGLDLRMGKVSVSTVPADHGFTVHTSHAKSVDLGTRFSVTATGESTRLDVDEGRVRIASTEGGAPVEVKAGYFAVAAKGVAPAAKPRVRDAGVVRRMAPNSWLAVPDTKMAAVVPTMESIRGQSGPRSVVVSWSGGALDPKRSRLLIWGGGFTSYHGNELYAFNVETLTWERLTEPNPTPALGKQVNADGTPVGRATYNGLAWLTHADRLFALGGDLARKGTEAMSLADITWSFDPETRTWADRKPSGARPPTYVLNLCAYDPETRKLWWVESNGDVRGLFSYDYDANVWTKHTTEETFGRFTATIDTRRGLLVMVGEGQIVVYPVRGPKVVRQTWKTTGGDRFIAKSSPGLDYDPVADRIVGWGGGAVFALDPETRAWTTVDAPGAPAATTNGQYETGTYGRWRYVPAFDAFVLVTSVDEDVHFFKFSK